MIQRDASNPTPSSYSCHSAEEHGGCPSCASGERLGFRFSYAYQPIVDLQAREIFAHEALVRGVNGEPAPSVLSQVTDENRFRFDQACRVKAIKTAAKLDMRTRLSINFMPNAMRASASATRNGWPKCFVNINASGFLRPSTTSVPASPGSTCSPTSSRTSSSSTWI